MVMLSHAADQAIAQLDLIRSKAGVFGASYFESVDGKYVIEPCAKPLPFMGGFWWISWMHRSG